MTTALLLLHTTETNDGTGRTLARTMPLAGTAPHAIYEPALDVEYVLLAPGQRAKSLRNLAGGVETNNRERDGAAGTDVYQVEIVARAAEVAGKSDAWYGNLRRYLRRKAAELGVPYVFPLPFAHDYGHAREVRLSNAEWYDPGLRGLIGHCHVPENTHWDPGPLDLGRLLVSDAPPPPSSINYGEVTMADLCVKLAGIGPLDDQGRGWTVVLFDRPVSMVVSAIPNAAHPIGPDRVPGTPDDGYVPAPTVSAAAEGGGVVLVVERGIPGQHLHVWVSAA
jgi:hypothetical protein